MLNQNSTAGLQRQGFLLPSTRKENKNLIKVGQGATGTGKSFFIRNKFCPEIFKEKDFILYLAPQTENIPVDEFDAAGLKHQYMFTRDPDSAFRKLNQGQKVVLGLTWAALCNASKKWDNIREEIKSLSSRSAWIVDECHSWLGVSAQAYYREVIGHRTPKFGATAMTLCQQSMASGNDLVFGFTATPITPFANPFTNPLAPSLLAPLYGCVTKPDTPNSMPCPIAFVP